MSDAWGSMFVEYELSNGRIVAILDEAGGAVVEDGLRLAVTEGRREAGHGQGEGKPTISVLEYYMTVEVAGAPYPEVGTGTKARIVIEGTHSNGSRVEARGFGYIGYDDKGNIEVEFSTPPTMLIGAEEYLAECDELGDRTAELMAKFHNGARPMLSDQYRRAEIASKPFDADWG